MWPFPKNRHFVDELIELSESESGAWKIESEYHARLGDVEFWIANGVMFFQPNEGKIPRLRLFERHRLWRAFRRSHDRMTLAELLK